MSETQGPQRIVFVTGMSGAGKSTTLKAFEDLGYEAIDNLPVALLGGFTMPGDAGHPANAAIGIDVRSRDFDARRLLAEIGRFRADPATAVTLLFLECGTDELGDRFKTTRRRHPLALDRPVSDGIKQERVLLAPLKAAADLVIDTTGKTLPDFRREMDSHFAEATSPGLTVFVTSFSFARGVPRDADLMFDVRFLGNPHYEDALRDRTGRDGAVQAFIENDPDFGGFMANLTALLGPLLPRYASEGKSYLTIAIGCTGGRHRSVFVAERLAAWLNDNGHAPKLSHRDLEKPAN